MKSFGIPETGYCAIVYKNLPLPLHACLQSARLCARPPACARV